ncbi:MAG: hypothetical protein WC091_04600 [Sulfuricellaceae bacterium]
MSDLATLIPTPVELSLNGKTLSIVPFKIGILPEMARTCAPFMDAFKPGAPVDWLALTIEHGENVFAALALASGQPQTWVEGLTAEEAIRLAQTVIEVNADFFIRRVLPSLTAAANGLTLMITAGRTPSSS